MLIDNILNKYNFITNPDAIFKIQNVSDYIRSTFLKPIQQMKNKQMLISNEVWNLILDETPEGVRGFDTNFIRGDIPIKLPFSRTYFEYIYGDKAKRRIGITASQLENIISMDIFEDDDRLSFWGSMNFHINPETFYLENSYFIPPENPLKDMSLMMNVAYSYCIAPLFGLQLLSCKNINYTPLDYSLKFLKHRNKRNKPYFEKYYVIQIEPMRKILDEKGHAQTMGLKYALHICRGHFRTYDEKPLFGKVTGTFWVPAHIRGDVSIGKIKKDYEIVI